MTGARTHYLLVIVAALGCLGLGYLALGERTALARANLDLETAQTISRRKVSNLRGELAAAREAQNRAEGQAAQLKQATAARGNPSAGDGIRTIHQSDIARDHPEYAAILARQNRRNMLQRYGAGLAALNLPPDKLAKMKDLLVEQSAAQQDVAAAAQAAGLKPGSPEYGTAMKEAMDDVNRQMTDLLGQDSAVTMRTLQATASIQNSVQYMLAPDLIDAGIPLSPGQNDALILAVGSVRAAAFGKQTPPGYYNADPSTGLSASDSQMLAAAAQVLSPEQLGVAKADLIMQNQQSAILQPYFKNNPGRGVSIEP